MRQFEKSITICKYSFFHLVYAHSLNQYLPKKGVHTVSWNAVLFLLNNKFPAYLSFSRKETGFEPDSS